MPKYRIIAVIEAPEALAGAIPGELGEELGKMRYRLLGLRMLSCVVKRVKKA